MTDARIAFQQLRAEAGSGYGAAELHVDLEAVERRVERARVGRTVVGVGATLAIVGVTLLVAPRILDRDDVVPVHTPSPTASASPSAAAIDTLALPCTAATVVEGNSVGDLGGMEGWFNGQLTGDGCESRAEWDEEIELAAAHPATVLINTIDNTMIEAYFRTDRAALGVYGELGGDFTVPDPDPTWPEHSAVLIDAQTGEVLLVQDFEEMDGFDPDTGEFDFSEGP